MKQICTILVNWNGKADTLECLGSLAQLNVPGGYAHNVCVVDNASSDDSPGEISKKWPSVHLICNTTNLGFTGANNKALLHALDNGADYVWLLNNDTVVDRDALTGLVSAFHNSSVGIAGSKIYFYKGHEYHKARYKTNDLGHVLWYAGGSIDWENMYASHRGVDEVDSGQYDKRTETEFVTGCSMMIRRAVLQSAGLFDDRYYLYLEDLEYSVRAKRKGFSLVYEPASRVWHKNAASSDVPGNPLHQYYMTRNRLLFGMTYAPLRTRFALVRQACRLLRTGTIAEKSAVSDALRLRFGERNSWRT